MKIQAEKPLKRRGRPARYLLSGIARCAVCDAPMRIGSQNHSAPSNASSEKPERYKVYECAGNPGAGGFHVSVRQTLLDEAVTGAVLARVMTAGVEVPRTSSEDLDGEERRTLRLEIKGHQSWLAEVKAESKRLSLPHVYEGQKAVAARKIRAAQERIEALEMSDGIVADLLNSQHIQETWGQLPMEQRRHIVQVLVTPRITPVTPDQRGQRGLDARRVQLMWRENT